MTGSYNKAPRPVCLRRISIREAAVLFGVVFLAAGCALTGPNAIRSGRIAYNEAINETGNQQMLMVPVHNRYMESNSLLAVASVTANVSMSGRAQVDAGFGDVEDYSGNLIPFRGSFIYEENPTISYLPVAGETYLQQLVTPVPISLLANITRSRPDSAYAWDMLLSSVNGIRNPSFLFDGQHDDGRFERFVALMRDLTRAHAVHWIIGPAPPEGVSLVIDSATPGEADTARELLALLGLSELEPSDGRWVVPAALALEGESAGAIAMTTRSVLDLVEILSAVVEVPAEDEGSGAAAEFPRPGRAGRGVRIRYAPSRPDSAYVAVEYRDGWFYIDDTDQATKRYFKLLGNLWSSAMAQTIANNPANPVLTVPVSR